MSVAYGGPPGGAAYLPPGRVNFGWLGEAFDLFKANVGVWIVATLMAFVPSLIGGIIGFIFGITSARSVPTAQPPFGQSPFGVSLTGGLPPGLSLVIDVFSAVYGAWLYGGIYRTAVKQVRGEIISIGDIFSGASLMWKILGFNIVYGLVVGIGLVLCLVPGFLLSGLLFPGYALIADGETVGNAISRSMDAMKRDMWNAAAFVFVMGLLIAVSIISCGLGLFVTLPMFFLVSALAYRDMIGMPGLNQAAPAYGAAGTAPGVWPPAPGAWPPPPQAYPTAEPPQSYPPAEPPQSYPATPPQQYSPPPPQQYPAFPPQTYPKPPEGTEPRRSLSGEPLDDPGQTPPSRGE